MRRALIAIVLLALGLLALGAPLLATEKSDGGKPGTNVDMPYLMAPMTGADGKLAGYAYISSRLTATSDTNALAVRDKLAFIQDAFVRDVNGGGVGQAGDPANVDLPALQARLLADAKRVMGAGAVASIVLVQVQIAPLHPTQAIAPDAPPQAADSVPAPAKPAKAGG